MLYLRDNLEDFSTFNGDPPHLTLNQGFLAGLRAPLLLLRLSRSEPEGTRQGFPGNLVESNDKGCIGK